MDNRDHNGDQCVSCVVQSVSATTAGRSERCVTLRDAACAARGWRGRTVNGVGPDTTPSPSAGDRVRETSSWPHLHLRFRLIKALPVV